MTKLFLKEIFLIPFNEEKTDNRYETLKFDENILLATYFIGMLYIIQSV